MSIEVFNESGYSYTPSEREAEVLEDSADVGVNEEALVDVASFALKCMDVHPDAELSIHIVDLDTIADLHVRWLDLEGPTDVMSFPMDELAPGSGRPDAPDPGPSMLGDIVLCPDFADRQARKAGHGLGHELALLTVHGCLHLLGYDHIIPAEEKEMFSLQNEILADWYDDLAARGVVYQPKPMNPGAFPTAAEREQLDRDMQEDSKTNPGTDAPGADRS